MHRRAKKYGATVEKPKGGSHWKIKLDGKTYPIPAHNGSKTEIDRRYIRGLCDCFEWDEDEFKSKL